jgi:hypothetical protein
MGEETFDMEKAVIMTTITCSRCRYKDSIPARNWFEHASDKGWIPQNWEGESLCRECAERESR